MKVTMLLCDHAAVADGKLYINGGGWSLTGPLPAPSAIALKIDVPWDRTNSLIRIVLTLVGEDGRQVMQAMEGAFEPITIKAEFEVGRPVGIPKGTAIEVPLAFIIPPLALQPGRRYSWDLEVDGETGDDWHLPFGTRPMQPQVSGGQLPSPE
jgi:hypothetical protein